MGHSEDGGGGGVPSNEGPGGAVSGKGRQDDGDRQPDGGHATGRYRPVSETGGQRTASWPMPDGAAVQPDAYLRDSSSAADVDRRKRRRSWNPRRWRWLMVVFCAALGAFAGEMWSRSAPPIYTADAAGFVAFTPRAGDDPNNVDPFGAGNFVQQRMDTYADLATSAEVLQGVAQDLHYGDVAELRQHVDATATPGTVILRVTVTDNDGPTAAQIADSVMANLGRTVAALEGSGTQLPHRLGSFLDARTIPPVKVVPIQPAIVPQRPSGNVLTMPLVGLFIGLILGSALFYLTRARKGANGSQEELASAEPGPHTDAITDYLYSHRVAQAVSQPIVPGKARR
jgi:uncharacterized protein involved in exopolysaccharide biosynthesis